MNIPSQYSEPSYFGKDTYVPFIGEVEDVNDPKRSGRVKVRCLGWHPKRRTEKDYQPKIYPGQEQPYQ